MSLAACLTVWYCEALRFATSLRILQPRYHTTTRRLRSFTLRNFIEDARPRSPSSSTGIIAKLYASQLH